MARRTRREGRPIADQLVLEERGDSGRAQEIIRAFAERTRLSAETEGRRSVFTLGPDAHSVEVVQTLTEIDPEWTEHLALGDPGAEPHVD
jgi:hypothetical protein